MWSEIYDIDYDQAVRSTAWYDIVAESASRSRPGTSIVPGRQWSPWRRIRILVITLASKIPSGQAKPLSGTRGTEMGTGINGALIDFARRGQDLQDRRGQPHRSQSAHVYPSEFISIVGPSGSGKSTLLNMITGIDKPTTGQVFVGGEAVHRLSENKLASWRGRHIGVVFQFFQLLPTLTVLENVMLPMEFCHLTGMSASSAR